MKYIGRNEESNALIGISESRRMWSIPYSAAKSMSIEELETMYEEDYKEGCEVVPNFTFTATIVPDSWYGSRESGSVIFRDTDDDRITYRMTQKSLYELLWAIINGEVMIVTGGKGIHGLFTFDTGHGNFLLTVYRG